MLVRLLLLQLSLLCLLLLFLLLLLLLLMMFLLLLRMSTLVSMDVTLEGLVVVVVVTGPQPSEELEDKA